MLSHNRGLYPALAALGVRKVQADLGWVGFDAANRQCPDEHYVRVACGRDYRDAAPLRGVRQGGRAEHMEVDVAVSAVRQNAQ